MSRQLDSRSLRVESRWQIVDGRWQNADSRDDSNLVVILSTVEGSSREVAL